MNHNTLHDLTQNSKPKGQAGIKQFALPWIVIDKLNFSPKQIKKIRYIRYSILHKDILPADKKRISLIN